MATGSETTFISVYDRIADSEKWGELDRVFCLTRTALELLMWHNIIQGALSPTHYNIEILNVRFFKSIELELKKQYH